MNIGAAESADPEKNLGRFDPDDSNSPVVCVRCAGPDLRVQQAEATFGARYAAVGADAQRTMRILARIIRTASMTVAAKGRPLGVSLELRVLDLCMQAEGPDGTRFLTYLTYLDVEPWVAAYLAALGNQHGQQGCPACDGHGWLPTPQPSARWPGRGHPIGACNHQGPKRLGSPVCRLPRGHSADHLALGPPVRGWPQRFDGKAQAAPNTAWRAVYGHPWSPEVVVEGPRAAGPEVMS